MRPPETRRGRALASPDFRLLFAGRTISLVGDNAAPIALTFGLLEATGSPRAFGLVMGARVLAMVIFLLLGGVIGDRFSRRSVLISTDLLRVGVQGLCAFLLITTHVVVWEFALLQVLHGAGQAFFRPTSTGMVPETVDVDQLQNANALLGVSVSVTSLFGPLLASALVALAGAGWTMALDAATYLASAGFLLTLKAGRSAAVGVTGGLIEDFRAGWKAFTERTWVVAMVLLFAVFHLVVFAPFLVLGPVVAMLRLGGSTAWGVIMAFQGAGALVGAGLALRLRFPRPLSLAAMCSAIAIAPLLALAVDAPLALVAAGACVGGAATTLADTLWQTTLQRRTEASVLGRVSSFDWFGSMALLPIGYALSGILGSALGTTKVLMICSGTEAAAVMVILVTPSVRRADRFHDPQRTTMTSTLLGRRRS
jgi:MFS family permease